ncbi:MAG: hypothetical protein IJK28_11640, partial [Clostridia bacterium]|nr:hypothetical protein [Clostridia bacterium]
IKNLTIPQELFNGTAPKESRGRSESPLVRPQAHSLTNGISLTKREEPFFWLHGKPSGAPAGASPFRKRFTPCISLNYILETKEQIRKSDFRRTPEKATDEQRRRGKTDIQCRNSGFSGDCSFLDLTGKLWTTVQKLI